MEKIYNILKEYQEKKNEIMLKFTDEKMIYQFKGPITISKDIIPYLVNYINDGNDVPLNFIKGEEQSNQSSEQDNEIKSPETCY